ncbi:MAG: hypothetical protein CMH52_12465 [Myxococcales bacterium]|nr:hypothetical protein [Myxococcales bacterium]
MKNLNSSIFVVLTSCLFCACSTTDKSLPSSTKAKVETAKAETVKKTVESPQPDSSQATSGKADLQAYGTLAKSLLDSIQSGKDAKTVGAMAEKLVALGERIASAFSKKHSDCGAYLGALLAASKQLTSLSLDAIERDYHSDGKLPKSPDDKCYHAKDLIVHPATVVILSNQGLAKKEQRDKATGEIAEVLAHLSDVEKNL